MDIDEFLDRELSDLSSSSGESQRQDIAIDTSQFEDQSDTSPLFEHIKSNISAGNLEEAESSYVQLWHILIQQRLKWDKKLHEQLLVLNRQFQGALAQAAEETKKKALQVYELISRARAALREGKKEEPYKIYTQIQDINNSIPSVFFEEKKIIQEQIMDFYKELKNTTDNELLKRVFALVQEIYQLIDRINVAIRSNDMTNAIVNYNKCMEFFNQIPEGFLRHKNPAGMRLLEIYKSLSIYSEISNLQKQLVMQPAHQQAGKQTLPAQQPTQQNQQKIQIQQKIQQLSQQSQAPQQPQQKSIPSIKKSQ